MFICYLGHCVDLLELLKDLGLERTKSTKLFVDNSSARQLAVSPVHH